MAARFLAVMQRQKQRDKEARAAKSRALDAADFASEHSPKHPDPREEETAQDRWDGLTDGERAYFEQHVQSFRGETQTYVVYVDDGSSHLNKLDPRREHTAWDLHVASVFSYEDVMEWLTEPNGVPPRFIFAIYDPIVCHKWADVPPGRMQFSLLFINAREVRDVEARIEGALRDWGVFDFNAMGASGRRHGGGAAPMRTAPTEAQLNAFYAHRVTHLTDRRICTYIVYVHDDVPNPRIRFYELHPAGRSEYGQLGDHVWLFHVYVTNTPNEVVDWLSANVGMQRFFFVFEEGVPRYRRAEWHYVVDTDSTVQCFISNADHCFIEASDILPALEQYAKEDAETPRHRHDGMSLERESRPFFAEDERRWGGPIMSRDDDSDDSASVIGGGGGRARLVAPEVAPRTLSLEAQDRLRALDTWSPRYETIVAIVAHFQKIHQLANEIDSKKISNSRLQEGAFDELQHYWIENMEEIVVAVAESVVSGASWADRATVRVYDEEMQSVNRNPNFNTTAHLKTVSAKNALIMNVPPHGNCFFDAVAIALAAVHGPAPVVDRGADYKHMVKTYRSFVASALLDAAVLGCDDTARAFRGEVAVDVEIPDEELEPVTGAKRLAKHNDSSFVYDTTAQYALMVHAAHIMRGVLMGGGSDHGSEGGLTFGNHGDLVALAMKNRSIVVATVPFSNLPGDHNICVKSPRHTGGGDLVMLANKADHWAAVMVPTSVIRLFMPNMSYVAPRQLGLAMQFYELLEEAIAALAANDTYAHRCPKGTSRAAAAITVGKKVVEQLINEEANNVTGVYGKIGAAVNDPLPSSNATRAEKRVVVQYTSGSSTDSTCTSSVSDDSDD